MEPSSYDIIKKSNMERTVFNDAQLELLKTFAFVKDAESLGELRKVVVDYFARKAKDEMAAMWKNGEMTEEKFNSFRTLHERTPYRRLRNAEHRS